jgi:hypothetical protein
MIDSLIIDIQYFGSINWINTLTQFSNIQIEQYESWQKMSFRNRTTVVGSHGPISLSVPLENGRNQRMLIKEVKISHQQPWETQHWRTIVSCYNRSPFFEYYAESLEQLLLKKRLFLLDLNLDILNWTLQMLGQKTIIGLSDAYLPAYPENITDLRGFFMPKKLSPLPPGFVYQQVFQDRTGFLENMGILDLLFNCGANAKALLKDCKFSF